MDLKVLYPKDNKKHKYKLCSGKPVSEDYPDVIPYLIVEFNKENIIQIDSLLHPIDEETAIKSFKKSLASFVSPSTSTMLPNNNPMLQFGLASIFFLASSTS